MMQHNNCLYCGKEFISPTLSCGCEQSRLKVVYYDDIKPIYKEDLLSVARKLPYIDFLDHEKNVLSHYNAGGWKAVTKYCDFVHQYIRIDKYQKLRESRRGRIILFVGKCITRVRKWVRKHLNNLNTTI